MVEECPHCRTLWLFQPRDIGKKVPCPKCRTPIAVAARSLDEAARILREHDAKENQALQVAAAH